jgi:sec-independent protein translocase protein TatA
VLGLGPTELIIILVVALVIIGPGKLPELGSALGRGIRDFKKSVSGGDEEEKAPAPQQAE